MSGTPGIASAANACGCCAGSEASTPAAVDNRMGLSAIAYRIGEYAQFKASLLAGLSSSAYPELAALRTRDADDFTLGLIDAVACAADVLTFYQERLANESYLRTATERVSLQELARLVGYRLRPGLAAETFLAFALEAPKTPPPGLPPDPGLFVTGIPSALELASGLKVQSVPGPGETPQTFETVETISARPEWNAIRPWLSEVRYPGFGAKEAWIQGTAHNLKAGDALVFATAAFFASPTTDTKWDFRFIDSVEIDTVNDRTRVRWSNGLSAVSSSPSPPTAPLVYVLRRRAAAFGNNAPGWKSMSQQFRDDYVGSDNTTLGEWPDFTLSPLAATETSGSVDLDVVASEVTPGGLVVLAKGNFGSLEIPKGDIEFPKGDDILGREDPFDLEDSPGEDKTPGPEASVNLYKIVSTGSVSRAQFALSGKVTRLALLGQHLLDYFNLPRAVTVFTQAELLPLARIPVTSNVAGAAIPLAVSPDGLEPGRRLLVTGRAVSGDTPRVHACTVTRVSTHVNGATVHISPSLTTPLARATVVVHANVAKATHGETVQQILGNGDASRPHQRFALTRLPLTHLSAATETGADSALTVRVGDVEWQERATLFGTGPTDRVYTLTTDEQERTAIVFGDGVRGARLPSGTNNVRAVYRQGLGQAGNVAADRLTQLVTRPLGLTSVSNPSAAEGGTDPEPADQARRTVPLGTRTLGRAVSLLDYEDFALAFTGIAKARAEVLHLPSGPTIAITLAGPDGAPVTSTNPVWQNLRAALEASGDPHVHVTLLSYQASTFRLGLRVTCDPAYVADEVLLAVEAALREHFAFDARALGQPVLQSDVIATAHAVPGVVAVDLDYLYGGTHPPAQTVQSRQTRLLASRMRVSGGVALPAELLTLNPAPFDRLEAM